MMGANDTSEEDPVNERIIVLDGARTPIGSFGGVFKDLPAHELGAAAVREALTRAGVGDDLISEVVMGCIGQVGPDAYNARRVAIAAGLPVSVPAFTVNRLCGSGLQAIWSAAQEMRWNALDFAIGGGDESMTRMPFYDFGARTGYRLGDRTLADGTVLMLTDPFHNFHMGVTAERVAEKYGISRAEQDELALRSQQLAATDAARAAFAEEITPVSTGGRKPVTVSEDEHPKPGTTLETLAGLRPAFLKEGTVTAGNASGLNDGAAAVLLMTEAEAARRGLSPLARIASYATAGLDPAIMGVGPIHASRKALEKAGWKATDLDLIEANEAFAAQACAVNKDMGWDTAKVNVNGGAIAIGHPIGASGARILNTLLFEMRRSGAKKGLATLCIGGGMGVAMCLERA